MGCLLQGLILVEVLLHRMEVEAVPVLHPLIQAMETSTINSLDINEIEDLLE